MWRRRLTWSGVLLVAICGNAHAGVLAEVHHGLEVAAGQEDHQKGDEPPEPKPEPAPTESCCTIRSDATYGYAYATVPSPVQNGGGVRTELYLGGQSVSHSDGAVTAEARASFAKFGVGVRGTSYFEQDDPKLNTYLHLDVWWLGLFWRLDQGENFNVWLELGATGLSDQQGLTMSGVGAGIRGARALVGALALVGGARYSWLQHDVHAGELFAGVQVSIMQIAYRIVDFDVGPPLRGPEVGVALTF
jgi:hypothetical protein